MYPICSKFAICSFEKKSEISPLPNLTGLFEMRGPRFGHLTFLALAQERVELVRMHLFDAPLNFPIMASIVRLNAFLRSAPNLLHEEPDRFSFQRAFFRRIAVTFGGIGLFHSRLAASLLIPIFSRRGNLSIRMVFMRLILLGRCPNVLGPHRSTSTVL